MTALAAWGLQARAMLHEDLPRVMAIENAIYPFPWTQGNFADSIEAGYQCRVFELQERPEPQGRQLLAYAVLMWIPDEVHLLNLSVAASWQGRGLGSAVLEWLCTGAVAGGAQGMLLEVRPSNGPALRLYERSGFERIGVRRQYYPAAAGQREDAWVMFRRFEPVLPGPVPGVQAQGLAS